MLDRINQLPGEKVKKQHKGQLSREPKNFMEKRLVKILKFIHETRKFYAF